MPEMDGIEVATNLRKITSMKVVIALATAEAAEVITDHLNLFDYIFEKPVKMKSIIDI